MRKRGGLLELQIKCQACGATLTVGEQERTTECPYCASPSVVERPATENRPSPSFVAGFVLDQERAAATVRSWIQGLGFFADARFKKAPAKKTRGVYIPCYLYSGVARSSYSADIGENYTVTETYTTTDSKGNVVTRTRTRTETEYRHLDGEHDRYILDVVVTASEGIGNAELEGVEPFDLRSLRRYDPKWVVGWPCEDPSLSQDACLQLAHQEALEKVAGWLRDFMPGDSHRNLTHQTQVDDEILDLVLLPIWVFAVRYRDDRDPVRILVNGQTGKVAGKVPRSVLRITLAVLLGVLGIGAILVFFLFFNQ